GPDALLSAPVAAVFADAGDLRGVVVEITEEAPVACYDALVAAIAPLRAAGAQLAVDDAGAGFASLKHVMVLRPSFVTVDRDLAEHAPRVGAAGDAMRAFAGDPGLGWVVVVDEYDRPIVLVGRRGRTHPPLRVLPTERLPDVARRVAARPTDERHTPMVLCDE